MTVPNLEYCYFAPVLGLNNGFLTRLHLAAINIQFTYYSSVPFSISLFLFSPSPSLYSFLGNKTGSVCVLERQNRFIYYLITKELYWHKPTYDSMRSSLNAMKGHCLQHKVCQVSMPKIGCGLDGLKWENVREILHEVFSDTEIHITVYFL
ncbi:MAG: hypothetical protein GY696_07580 [Gammaproteobacteria bacterium]|nr:hypothetical protein [Gammaproteobacteria bacterium]